MHIAFRVPRFHTNMLGWVELLESSGHTVSLLIDRAEPTEAHHAGTLFVTPLRWRKRSRLTPKGPNSGAPSVSIKKWLRTAAPDVLVVRDFNSAESVQALVLGYRLRLNTVLYLQIRSFDDLRTVHSLAIRFFCAVTRTKILSPLLLEGRTDRSRWSVVPFLPHSGFFSSETINESSANLRLLSVGKFVQRKRHDLALECLANLDDAGRADVSLTVIGELSTAEHRVWRDQLVHQIHERGLERQVRIHVNVPPSRMPEILQNHDVLLMLSENEPAAIIVLEALAAGLVVVVREGNRTSKFVQETGSGAVLLSDDPRSLDAGLRRALATIHRTSRAERVRRYRSTFGPAAVKSAWEELLAPSSLRRECEV